MAAKMTLVYVKETGHVLGAVTRQGEVSDQIKPEELVGQAFERHDPKTGDTQMSIEAATLAAINAPLDTTVLLRPDAHAIDDKTPKPVVPLVANSVNLTRTGVVITQATLADAPLKVWAQVEGGPRKVRYTDTTTLPAKVAGGPSTADAAITFGLPPGDHYFAIVLVEGREPRIFSEKTIP